MQETPSQVPMVRANEARTVSAIDFDAVDPGLLRDLVDESMKFTRWGQLALVVPFFAFVFRRSLALGPTATTLIFFGYFAVIVVVNLAGKRQWTAICESYGISKADAQTLRSRLRLAYRRMPTLAVLKMRKRNRVDVLMDHYGHQGAIRLPK